MLILICSIDVDDTILSPNIYLHSLLYQHWACILKCDSPLFFYISTKEIDLWLNMLIFQRFLVLDFSIVNILIVINYAKPAFACSYFRPKFFFKLFSKKMSVSDGSSFLADLNSFSLDCRSSFMLVLFTEINIFSSFT